MPQEDMTQFGPEWYSGGGKRRANLLDTVTDPAVFAAIRAKAQEMGIPDADVVQYVNYHFGQKLGKTTLTPQDILGDPGRGAIRGAGPGQLLGAMPPVAPQAPITAGPIREFLEQKRLNPLFAARVGASYEKEPGALKYIADLGRGHLEQKARKPYTKYEGKRIAEFQEPQTQAHQGVQRLVENAAPQRARHENILEALAAQRRGPGAMEAMQPHLTRGTSPIGEAERNQFVQAARQNVLRPLQEEMTENLLENILPAINKGRIMAGNLRGPKTAELRERALRKFERELLREGGKHLYQAQLHGQTAAEHERERAINAAQLAGNARSHDLESQLEAGRAEQGLMGEQNQRELTGLEALSNVGSQQQKLKQQEYELKYQDYLNEQEGVMPHLKEYSALMRGTNIPQTRTAFTPQVPEANIMSQLGGLGVMATGGLWGGKRKQEYQGGRIKLADGGIATRDFNADINMFKDRLRSMTFPTSMAGQQVQDDLINQMVPDQPQAPQEMAPPQGPIEKGAHGALSTLDKMNAQRSKMEADADAYGSGEHDANPWGSALMHLGAGLAGSNPKFSERLGAGAQGALSGFEQTQAANKQNEVISQNIRKSLLDTYQKEHENDLKMQHEKELEFIKAGSPKASKIYYNKKTGTHYTLDENRKMVVVPGAPAPVTPEAALKAKGTELRMEEEIKGEQANINKLREIANKSQASIGNYGTVKRLLEDSGVSKHIGPIKGKFYQNPKVQALMSAKAVTSIQEFNGAINKVVLDDIKMMGANPSDRDVRIVENSKPSPTDTPEAALKKALINEAAQRRMQNFANFTHEMWSKHGIRSFESQKAFNAFMQDNPQFNENGDVILKPHSKPEDYLDNDSRIKAGLEPLEEKEHPEEEAFEDVREPTTSHESSKLSGNDEKDREFAKEHIQQIRAAKILKMSGSQ